MIAEAAGEAVIIDAALSTVMVTGIPVIIL
jgi:hypothetical protein